MFIFLFMQKKLYGPIYLGPFIYVVTHMFSFVSLSQTRVKCAESHRVHGEDSYGAWLGVHWWD